VAGEAASLDEVLRDLITQLAEANLVYVLVSGESTKALVDTTNRMVAHHPKVEDLHADLLSQVLSHVTSLSVERNLAVHTVWKRPGAGEIHHGVMSKRAPTKEQRSGYQRQVVRDTQDLLKLAHAMREIAKVIVLIAGEMPGQRPQLKPLTRPQWKLVHEEIDRRTAEVASSVVPASIDEN